MMVCGCLADTGHNHFVTVSKMGKELGVPPYVLAKVVQRLTRAGILESLRGPNGGARLSSSAKNMPLRRLTTAFDDLTWLDDCPFRIKHRADASPCPVHSSWEIVRSSVRTFIDGTTIGDLTSNNPPSPPSES
jgi:Rrf2 family transcriptional regulator, iron-sulfur cluster assembly transcription factor